MYVSAVDFIKSPDFYLDKVVDESVLITKDGRTIAVLEKPGSTPIADSLLGLLKDTGIKCADDIKAMMTGI
ncbi:MAG: hypothetical protein LBJ21_01785 [Acidobacteriota bacterium]|jgi:hypothetical protein|nr:hypothetical protein [Acidobacteriota bacterium]